MIAALRGSLCVLTLSALMSLAGCVDNRGTGPIPDGGADAGGPVTCPAPPAETCAVHMGSEAPFMMTGTSSGSSASEGSCGGGMAGESSFLWTAPSTGVFNISTRGTTYDAFGLAYFAVWARRRLVYAPEEAFAVEARGEKSSES